MDSNITIIGAGVVGLAIAAELSKSFDNIFIIEKHLKFGQETSSRNSEVIHSGIYYPHGSLKAKLCVKGKKLLYEYCKKNEILHKACGKIIVATDDFELAQIQKIYEQAKGNGVSDHKIIDPDEISELEPNVSAVGAIHFPTTGIIDTHGLMKQLETDACINGVQMVYGSEVVDISKIENGYEIALIDADGENYSFTTEKVINSAGLFSDQIASMVGIDKPDYRLYYWKGEYFSVGNGKHKLVNSLIYPVPLSNTVSLGIHATVDLNGRMKLGPSASYLEKNEIDYSINQENKKIFFESASRFLPFLEPDDLLPDQAGIRPKLQKPGDAVRDFIINEESGIGYPGFINLIGIESPGLTSCLAIGRYVKNLVNKT